MLDQSRQRRAYTFLIVGNQHAHNPADPAEFSVPARSVFRGSGRCKICLPILKNVNGIRCRHSARNWLRGRDLNPRPSGYEPDELPGCSTPRLEKLTMSILSSKANSKRGDETRRC